MNAKILNSWITRTILVACLPLLASSAYAGPIILVGLDPEDHAPDGSEVISDLMDFVVTESTRRPNPFRIVQLGGSGGGIGASLTNAALIASGLGFNLTVVNGTDILAVDLTNYDAIYMPTNERDLTSPKGFYGLLRVEIGYINQRASDIRAFVNSGGGCLAFSQNEPNGFGWFPLGQIQTQDYGFGGITGIVLTPEGASFLDKMQLMHAQPFHQAFLGPPGFFGLSVLARQSAAPGDAVIIGGRSACIGPFLILSPSNDTNPACTLHTLTAVATADGGNCAPKANVPVTFEVLSGPNAGVSGMATTDSNGSCQFAYTGAGGPGTDQIQARFTSPDTGNLLISNVATKIWQNTNANPVIGGVDPRSITVGRNSVCPDAANQLGLTATDSDGPTSALNWSVFTAPTRGSVSFIGSTNGGSVTACYQPNAGETGADSFVIKVADGCAGMDTVTVNVTIIVPNAPPVITEGDSLSKSVGKNTTCPGVPNRVTLNATDADTPLTSLAWNIQTPPATGSVTILSTTPPGRIVVCYQPNPNQIANDSFVMRVIDGAGGADTITINVTVTNQSPVIAQGGVKSITVNQDSNCGASANLVPLNASDADDAASSLSWSVSTLPTTGTVSFIGGVSTGGAVTVCYVPNAGQAAADSFVIRVADPLGGFATIIVNVTVIASANCPVISPAGPIAMNVGEDSNCAGAGNTISLSATDSDSPPSSFVWSASAPTKGTVSFPTGTTGGSVQVCYTPGANQTGSDTFVVSATDGTCGSSGSVTINVTIASVPDCPIISQGSSKSVTVVEDSTCGGAGNTFTLIASDPDTLAGSLTWSATTPSKGSVSFPNGNTGLSVQVCYTPNPNASGDDDFSVSVSDGSCGSNTTISVDVTITAVDDCPAINSALVPMPITVQEDSNCGGIGNTFTLTAADPDSPAASLTWSATTPSKGALSFPNGNTGTSVQVCYTPGANQTGADSFVVSVTDGTCGGSGTLTVNVTITSVEDCPTINQGSSTSITVQEDSNCGGVGNAFTLSATDPDSPVGSLTWSTTTPAKGGVSFPNGNIGASVQVCYTPGANQTGSDSFVVSVSDGTVCSGGAKSITVNVTINAVADCPTITQGSALSINVVEDSTCGGAGNTFVLTASDPDTAAGSLIWSTTGGVKGSISFPAGNMGSSVQVCYTPSLNRTGPDSFIVSVSDGTCGSSTSISVSVNITPVADCPAINQGGTLSMTVLQNSDCNGSGNKATLSATDPDSPSSTLAWSSTTPTKGAVSFPNGATGASVVVCYTPNVGQVGSDSFIVNVTDNTCGGSTSIAISVSINPLQCPTITEGAMLNIMVNEDSTCAGAGNTFTINATDPDSPLGSLTWSATTSTKGGVTFPNGNTGGSVLVCYTPSPNASSNDSFVVSVQDGNCGGVTSINVSVIITPIPDCPTITQGGSLAINVAEDSNCGGTGNTFTLSATDPDSPLGTLTWSNTAPGKGSVTFVGGNMGGSVQVCYTPAPDASGTDSFSVSVGDGTCGGTTTINIGMTITPVNDCPRITEGSALSISVIQNSDCAGLGNTFTLQATDPDSPAASFAWSATTPTKGGVSFPNGLSGGSVQVCYTPNPGQLGSDTFTVNVTDGTCGGSGSIVISVSINPFQCPIISQGSQLNISVQEDSNCAGAGNTFSLNALDFDSPSASLVWSAGPAGMGSVSFPMGTSGAGVQVCYAPLADAFGNDSFIVSVTDNTCGSSSSITINVTLTPIVDCPVISQGSSIGMSVLQNTVCADSGNTVVLSATDVDSPAASLTWSTATAPTRGAVSFPGGTLGGSVQVCYTPNAGQIGSDSFVINVTDGFCGSGDSITVNVTINPFACPIVSQGSLLNITVQEDSNCGGVGNTFNLSATDQDSPLGSLSWSALGAAKGVVTFPGGNTGGSVQVCYTPNANADGSDSFIVNVSDGNCGGGGAISVNVTITPIPDCPVVTQGSSLNITVNEDSLCSGAGNTVTLNATDPDTPAGSLVWTASAPSKGAVTFPGGNTGASVQVCYRPNANQTGGDAFVVSLNDGDCGSVTTITINVTITAIADCPAITQGGLKSITVQEDSNCGGSGNQFGLTATDPDSAIGSLTWFATGATKGAVTFPGGNTGGSVQVCYTPNANTNGADSFSVNVSDGTCGGTGSISVSVTITSIEDCPTINQGGSLGISVAEDSNCAGAGNAFTLTVTDPDTPAGSLNWSATSPANGAVSFPSGTTGAAVLVCYTPNADADGNDSFVVMVSDGTCGSVTTLVVNVTITPSADCPRIDQSGPIAISVGEDSTCAGAGNSFTLSASDPDSPVGGLTWSSTTPALGSVSFPGGSTGGSVQVCYTPNSDASGNDSFTVSVSDGSVCSGNRNSITINVTINPVPDCPTITGRGASMNIVVVEDSDCGGPGNSFTLAATDPDSPLGSLLWSATSPTKGAVSFPNGNAGASVTVCYTPAPDANGNDSFNVLVSDGTCPGSTSISVTVTIIPVADCPEIDFSGPLQLTVQQDSTCAGSGNSFTLTAKDPDSPAGSLIWSASAPSQGSVSFPGGNMGQTVQVCYTPNAGALGGDSFTIFVSDNTKCEGDGSSLLVNVNINLPNCPVISQGSLLMLGVEEDSACGPNTFTLNAVDGDTPAGSLTWSTTVPTKGTASIVGVNTGASVQVCYVPNANATGNDSFVVSVADGECGSASITVEVQISSLTDCPIITQLGPINMNVGEDSVCGLSGNTITLSATDPDSPLPSLSWSTSPPSKGTISFPLGNVGASIQICYTPNANADGADSFTVFVTDNTCKGAGSVLVNVSIGSSPDCPNIQQKGPINLNVGEDSDCGSGGNTFILSAVDPDSPAGSLVWSASTPALGVVTFPGGNTGASVQVCYTPNADASGADSFTVFVEDGTCGEGGAINVNVQVNPINDCPGIVTGEAGVLNVVVQRNSICSGVGNTFTLNAVDAEGDAITWSASIPAKGTVTFPNGTFGASVQVCYTPNTGASGADVFLVNVTDGECAEPLGAVINVGIHCGAVSGDCNGNGIPDNCEIADNPSDDSDGDGVLNACDACPADPANDADGDGVCGNVDQCPNTPPGTKVDSVGCPLPCQDGDADADGVCNSVDQCSNTPAGTQVDAAGCPVPPGGQAAACQASDDDTLNLLMSVLFRAPVCGCGIMLTGLVSFLGIIGMKAGQRRIRRRPGRKVD